MMVIGKRRSGRRGFTLTEAAIALGISTLVISAGWVAAAAAWRNYQTYSVYQQMWEMVQDMRNRTYQPPATQNNITNALFTQGMIPVEMRVSNGNYTHLMGGAFSVDGIRIGTEPQVRTFVRFNFNGLDKQKCANLLIYLPVLSEEAGIFTVTAPGGNVTIDLNNIANPGGAVPLPLSATTASAWCNAAGNNNNVSISFRMR